MRPRTELNPSSGGYWLGLGKVAVQLNDWPALPIRQCARLVSLDPNSADAQNACSVMCGLKEKSAAGFAWPRFMRHADLDPKDSVSICLQGYVMARMGRAVEAKPFYARALKLDPHDDLAAHLMAGLDPHD